MPWRGAADGDDVPEEEGLLGPDGATSDPVQKPLEGSRSVPIVSAVGMHRSTRALAHGRTPLEAASTLLSNDPASCSLPARMGRTESPRHASTSSAGSASEMIRTPPSSATSIPLQNIVAVSRLDDGKPAFCIEVAQVDDDTSRAGFMTLQLRDPSEADTWVDGIRRAVAAARDIHAVPYPQRSLEYVARAVERERDYDPGHFQIFRVVQRGAGKTVAGASSEDLSKMTSSVCYLVVGIHKIHLIPVSRPLSRSSASSLGELESSTAYGILAVTSIDVKGNDDSLEIFVRYASAITPVAPSSLTPCTLLLGPGR